ncbi:hypothetical protein FSP39_020136 [Pinctada imbricata]|uniref:MACPF domain-containing protein n=1 Tax=Pinctada imbricata TaxID=66713 RepID=A0AA88YEM4_PINIB|nr:hypothetical protein FSP39_020136 [Pinctada imbricata]
MRSDYRLQECQGPQFKRSFPNIDYSLLGYNILRGFPMATGHDPGFTKPIFSADYTNGIQTADCRFSIPKGYVVIPDISCISSFSSKTVKSNYEFARALSVAANINVGGWGAQFSASTEYKETFSEMSSGESVFILSTAKCDYYFSKLIEYDSPPLDQTFLRRVRILEKSVTSYDFFEFFNTYGTHFATMVTFGASFTYEHKMSLSKFEEKQGQGIKLGIQAGYAGVVSVGGGFNLDSSQQQSASEFMKDVETRTISVGAAPPANGDALTWASTVKDNPVPTRYTLESIENLFSAKYFHSSEVDYHKIKNKIKQYKGQYCEFLRQLGEVNSCLQLHPGVMMKKTKLSVTTEKLLLPKPDCEKKCFETQGCVAITYCVRCRPENFSYMTCYMYGARNKTIQGGIANDFETMIFTSKLNKYKIFQNTAIIGNKRQLENGTLEHKDESECFKACTNDVHCIAFTFYSKSAIIEKCHIYAEDGLLNMRSEIYTNTYIMSWKTQNLDL